MKEVIVNAEDLVCLNKEKLQEIIRCKDCKYWYQDFDGKCIASTPYGTDTDEDDFCSRAERKEE